MTKKKNTNIDMSGINFINQSQWFITPAWLKELSEMGGTLTEDMETVKSVAAKTEELAATVEAQPGINSSLAASNDATNKRVSTLESDVSNEKNRTGLLENDLRKYKKSNDEAVASLSSSVSTNSLAATSYTSSAVAASENRTNKKITDLDTKVTDGLQTNSDRIDVVNNSAQAAIQSVSTSASSGIAELNTKTADLEDKFNSIETVSKSYVDTKASDAAEAVKVDLEATITGNKNAQAIINDSLAAVGSSNTSEIKAVKDSVETIETKQKDFVKSVNGDKPDIAGNVEIKIATSFEDIEGDPLSNAALSDAFKNIQPADNSELDKAIKSLASESTATKADVDSLKTSVSDVESKLTNVEKVTNGHTITIKELQETVDTNRIEVNKNVSDLDTKVNDYQVANKQSNASLATDVSSLSSAVSKLQSDADGVNTATQGHIDSLTTRVNSNEASITSLSSSTAASIGAAEANATSNAVSQANKYTDEAIAKIPEQGVPEGVQADLTSLAANQNAQAEAITNVEGTVSKHSSSISNLEQKTTDMSVAINDTNVRLTSNSSSLASDITKARSDFDTKLNKEIADRKAGDESLSGQISTVNKTIEGIDAKATKAESDAGNAKTAADEAKVLGNDAKSLATTSSTKADSAGVVASNASTLAKTADTKATDATALATTATTTATGAKSTADKAVTDASKAQTTANSASAAATGAQSTADKAITSATNANTLAIKANASANTANAGVESINTQLNGPENNVLVGGRLSGETEWRPQLTAEDVSTGTSTSPSIISPKTLSDILKANAGKGEMVKYSRVDRLLTSDYDGGISMAIFNSSTGGLKNKPGSQQLLLSIDQLIIGNNVYFINAGMTWLVNSNDYDFPSSSLGSNKVTGAKFKDYYGSAYGLEAKTNTSGPIIPAVTFNPVGYKFEGSISIDLPDTDINTEFNIFFIGFGDIDGGNMVVNGSGKVSNTSRSFTVSNTSETFATFGASAQMDYSGSFLERDTSTVEYKKDNVFKMKSTLTGTFNSMNSTYQFVGMRFSFVLTKPDVSSARDTLLAMNTNNKRIKLF